MSMVGQQVSFESWKGDNGPVTAVGTVECEFTDPEERHARASYGVRTADGDYHTPYADECWAPRGVAA